MTASKIIQGVVRSGNRQGKNLGAPTANLDICLAKDLPKGLYSCTVFFANEMRRGLLYYGVNSLTRQDCLEVYLNDFNADLYGVELRIEMEKFIREPKEFVNREELQEQIKRDIIAAFGG